MGGSGGSPATSAGSLPEWIAGPHQNLVAEAEAFAYGDRGSYIPYGNERIAGFTDNELAAQQARVDLYNKGDIAGDYAAGQLDYAASINPLIQQEAFRTFHDNADQYMSPYMSGVIDPALREADESFNRRINQSEAASVARGGGIGSYRQGLENAFLEAERAQSLSDIRRSGMQDAWESGLSAFNADRQARVGGLSQAIGNAGQLAGTADQVGTGNLSRMNTLITELERSGSIDREMRQRELDMAYQDFIDERDFPMRNMSFLSSIMSGVPNAAFSQTTANPAQPGLLSQMAALGLGGAAIGQAFGLGGG